MKVLSILIDKYKIYKLQKMFPVLKQAFHIASHLTPEERVQLYLLSKNRDSVLEIGSYLGASACCFGAAIKSRGSGRIYCIDTWNNDAMTEGKRDTWQEFRDNIKSYKEYIVPIRGLSTDVVDEVASHVKTLDLLFIDSDHSYESVKADWDTYKKFLKPNSVVVFHDWGWAEGVKRIIEEDVVPLVSNQDNLPNMWWGTIRTTA